MFDPALQISRRMCMSLERHTEQTSVHVPYFALVGKGAAHERIVETLTDPAPRTDEWTNCLIKVKAAKDAQQFARLFGHFAPRIKSFLIKSGASEGQAEEAAQEAMATVWRKADKFDPARASAATWIFTIARNKQIDAIRKLKRPEPEDIIWDAEPPIDPSDAVETSQQEKILRQAINGLPERQREMIERAYLGELSHSEIADITGLPLGTIKSRIRLALERLRHEMTS